MDRGRDRRFVYQIYLQWLFSNSFRQSSMLTCCCACTGSKTTRKSEWVEGRATAQQLVLRQLNVRIHQLAETTTTEPVHQFAPALPHAVARPSPLEVVIHTFLMLHVVGKGGDALAARLQPSVVVETLVASEEVAHDRRRGGFPDPLGVMFVDLGLQLQLSAPNGLDLQSA